MKSFVPLLLKAVKTAIELILVPVFILLAPLLAVFGDFRKLLFLVIIRFGLWGGDYPSIFKFLLLYFYLQIAIGIPGIVYEYLGSDHLFEAIVGAGFFLAFVALQLPRMLPPYFIPVFLPTQNGSYSELPVLRQEVNPSSTILLYIRCTNLGTTFFKDCVFSFSFDEGFTILDNPQRYEGLDFEKRFILQRNNRCAQFLPNINYLGFSPLNHLMFPIWVNTPQRLGKYKVRITLSSESTWGESEEVLTLRVVRKTTKTQSTQNRNQVGD